jgi:predicted amidohydrolase
MTILNIALAQAEFTPGGLDKNRKKAQKMIEEAALQGADLILLPELWSSGYDLENCSAYGSDLESGWFAWMQSKAVENRLAVGGSLIEEQHGRFYNTFTVFDHSGSLLGAYRKIHLFELLNEKDYLDPGNEMVTFEYRSTKIGLAICYDLRFPELFRAYATDQVELVLLVAEWPERRVEHWNLLIRARAIENQCYVAAVNKTGESYGESLGGSSVIIDPMGEVVIQGNKSEELLIAEVNLSDVTKIRRWMPVLKDQRPDLYVDIHRDKEE